MQLSVVESAFPTEKLRCILSFLYCAIVKWVLIGNLTTFISPLRLRLLRQPFDYAQGAAQYVSVCKAQS